MGEITFELPDEYPKIILCTVVIAIYVLLMPYLVVIPKRNKLFSQRYMARFANFHVAAFGESADLRLPAGFPDDGNGIFANSLPYKDWYELNNTIRVFHNFVESLPQILGIILVSGVFYPQVTLIVAVINCLARPLYIYQYLNGGPNKRILGAVGGSLPLYLLGVVTTATIIKGML